VNGTKPFSVFHRVFPLCLFHWMGYVISPPSLPFFAVAAFFSLCRFKPRLTLFRGRLRPDFLVFSSLKKIGKLPKQEKPPWVPLLFPPPPPSAGSLLLLPHPHPTLFPTFTPPPSLVPSPPPPSLPFYSIFPMPFAFPETRWEICSFIPRSSGTSSQFMCLEEVVGGFAYLVVP